MDRIQVKDIVAFLETVAPAAFQESYDNSGLITGDPEADVTGILVTLDCTEPIVDEAIRSGYNMIVAHHPIVFKGLKRLTGKTYVERTIIKAIRHNIAILAVHTNLDNVFAGVNHEIASRLGLKNLKILVPKRDTLHKLVTFVPPANAENVLKALHEAGAGNIGKYAGCSFSSDGIGRFTATGDARPAVGSIGVPEQTAEVRIEVIVPAHLEGSIIAALKKSHPYEEVAWYSSGLLNENQEVGAGMIGEYDSGMEPKAFLERLKFTMNTACVRHTSPGERLIRKVALCGGSGSFLLGDAIRAKADAYVSADFKYHEFFDADGKILIADIGHYESEAFTKQLLCKVLREKFTKFAINFSEVVTNPISYL